MTMEPAGHDGALAIAQTRRMAARGVASIAVLSLVCSMGMLAAPLFNMQVFNRVLSTRDAGTLGKLMLGLAICLLLYSALDLLRGMALEALAGRVTRRLSLPLLRAVAEGGRGQAAMAEALTDIETLRGFFASPACTAPFDAALTPVLLIVLAALHWSFAAMALLFCLVLMAMNLLGDRLSKEGLLAANTASAAAMRRAGDAVNAAEAVLANGMLPTLSRRWQDSQAKAANLVHGALLRARAVSSATGALRFGMTGAMVGLGLVLALWGMATGGAMVASNMILSRLLLPFQQIAATRQRWIDAAAAWRRVRKALEASTPPRYTAAMPAPIPRLAVERLVYVPPGGERPLLRGVSFVAEPGEAIGIIGPSSSGKTTLLRLIAGMAPPTAGGAFLDGTSTWLWEREDFARHTGYVPQGLVLQEATVAENIARLASPDMPGVIEAAKRAGAHGFIARLPHGYATIIAGAALSSGQRQRVALARALYAPQGHARPGLLLLDEPSGFLDRDGEAGVVALLARLRDEGVTVLIVTHRPTLLATVDKVVVLTDGLVSQYGPRDEVLASLAAPRVRLVRPTEAAAGAVSGAAP
jgi:ATP-binding cassette subfamily C protein